MSFDHRIDYIFTLLTSKGLGTSNDVSSPYESHCHGFHVRQYILVVEPSPGFHLRRLAADYPLVHCFVFQTITSAVSSYVVVQNTLGSSSNSPSYPLTRYQVRRPANITLRVVKFRSARYSLELALLVLLELGCCSS